MRSLASDHFALTDQTRGKLRSTALFAAGAAKDQSISTIFQNRLRVGVAICAGDLRDGLEAQHAPATEFSQPRQCIL